MNQKVDDTIEKVLFVAIWVGILICTLTGCSTFSTKQTDITSYDNTGKPTRTITTTATAKTLFSSKSELTKFKATNTDKTQSTSVGSLAQESTSSNAAPIFEAIGRGVVQGLAAGAK